MKNKFMVNDKIIDNETNEELIVTKVMRNNFIIETKLKSGKLKVISIDEFNLGYFSKI